MLNIIEQFVPYYFHLFQWFAKINQEWIVHYLKQSFVPVTHIQTRIVPNHVVTVPVLFSLHVANIKIKL